MGADSKVKAGLKPGDIGSETRLGAGHLIAGLLY